MKQFQQLTVNIVYHPVDIPGGIQYDFVQLYYFNNRYRKLRKEVINYDSYIYSWNIGVW